MGNRKIIIVAIILAVITTLMVYSYINQIKTSSNKQEYLNVIVAVKTIEEKDTITDKDVKVANIVKEYVNSGAFTDINDVIGKKAQAKIVEGEQVVRERIIDEDKATLAYQIPEGKRAVTVNVNEAVEVGDFIRPGDYVDILATFDALEFEEGANKIKVPRSTNVVLQDIMVLGMGQLQTIPDVPRTELPKTVTLAVTLEEAEKLTFSEETGVIKMVLRRTGDHNKIQTNGALRSDIDTDRGVIVSPK